MSKQSSRDPYKYVALGDSLANGVGANNLGYPQILLSKLQQHRPTKLHLFAVNGQTSTQLLQKQNNFRDYFSQADLITINIGGNDLRLTWRLYGNRATPTSFRQKRFNIALSTLANNWNELAKIISHQATPQTKVVFINLYNPYQHKHPQTRPFVAEANQLLHTICANYSFELIDARGILNQASKDSSIGRDSLLAKDQIHLSAQGQDLIASAIYQLIYPLNVWDKLKRFLGSLGKLIAK